MSSFGSDDESLIFSSGEDEAENNNELENLTNLQVTTINMRNLML